MAIGGWLRLIAAVAIWWRVAASAPETYLVTKGCSQYNATNATVFLNNLNSTFYDLRSQLSGGQQFATAEQLGSSDQIYAMAQCRTYMSESDCLACYDFAVSQIRNCSTVGARLVYDGCFLRYESYNFYEQTIENTVECGETNAALQDAFTAAGRKLLNNLQLATPRINGYSAATKAVVSDNGLTIYAVAQCVETVSEIGCQGCLNAAYESLQVCFPVAEGRLADAACFMRYSDTPFFSDNQTMDITPFLTLGGGGNWVNEKALIGGVVGGGGGVVIIVAALLWARSKKGSERRNILGATELQSPNVYSFTELKAATNNFSEHNKLGEGSFGVVYKATLRNGNVVAVKKLDMNYRRAKADFESEGRLISNVHHRNLVRLLGCCTNGSHLLLIYEYMHNGSLDTFLYGEKQGKLTWKQRFDIIFGIARGIAYLHEHYHVTIIHRDIKPSNILLDHDYQPKIADFGLARLLPENQTHVNTKFAGTLGYTAPEYAIGGHLSEKVDVYSFGVVILEIVSGRRCSDVNADSSSSYLLEEAWKLYESGMAEKLADEALELKSDDVKKMVEIGLLCTQSSSSSRPTMSEAVAMLLSDGSDHHKPPTRQTTASFASDATVSFTRFTGR